MNQHDPRPEPPDEQTPVLPDDIQFPYAVQRPAPGEPTGPQHSPQGPAPQPPPGHPVPSSQQPPAPSPYAPPGPPPVPGTWGPQGPPPASGPQASQWPSGAYAPPAPQVPRGPQVPPHGSGERSGPGPQPPPTAQGPSGPQLPHGAPPPPGAYAPQGPAGARAPHPPTGQRYAYPPAAPDPRLSGPHASHGGSAPNTVASDSVAEAFLSGAPMPAPPRTAPEPPAEPRSRHAPPASAAPSRAPEPEPRGARDRSVWPVEEASGPAGPSAPAGPVEPEPVAPTPAAEPDPPVAEETAEPVEPGPPAAVPDSALRVSEPDAPVAGEGPESAEPADPVVTPPEPGTAVSPPPATRPDASVSQDAHGPAEQAASAASPEPQAAVSPPAGAEPEVPDVPAATVDAEATETFVRPAQAWFGSGSDTAARRPPAVRPPHPGTPTVVTAPGAGDSPNPDAEETDTFVVRAADRRASAATRGEAVPSAPDAAAPVDGSPAEPEHVPVPGGYEQRIIALAPVPVSRWGRALFAATGGRLNLG